MCIYKGGDPKERNSPLGFNNISSAHTTSSDHQRADLSTSLKHVSLNIKIYLFNLLVPKFNQDMVWSSVNIQRAAARVEVKHGAFIF